MKIRCKNCNEELAIWNPLNSKGEDIIRDGNWIAAHCTKCRIITTLYEMQIHSEEYYHFQGKCTICGREVGSTIPPRLWSKKLGIQCVEGN